MKEVRKRGRKPIIPSTPEGLWKAFEQYREECEGETTVNEKTGITSHRPLNWPRFLDSMGSSYKPERFKEYYRAKGDLWVGIIARIENAIEADQLEGALRGDYSPNIVARINGYADRAKTENTHNGSVTIKLVKTGYTPASSEEEILKREGINDGTI